MKTKITTQQPHNNQKEAKYGQNIINQDYPNQPNKYPTTHGVANYRKSWK